MGVFFGFSLGAFDGGFIGVFVGGFQAFSGFTGFSGSGSFRCWVRLTGVPRCANRRHRLGGRLCQVALPHWPAPSGTDSLLGIYGLQLGFKVQVGLGLGCEVRF